MELDSQRLQSHLQKVIGGIITAFVAGVIGQAICSISSIRSTYVGSFPLRGAIKLGVAVVIASILGGIFSSLKFIITYYAGRSAKIKSIGEIEPISVNVLGFIYLLVLGNLFLDSFQSLFYRQRWVITLGKGILIFIAALIVFDLWKNIKPLISRGSEKIAEKISQVSEKAPSIKCPKCGTENSSDAKFCSNCATPLANKKE